MILYKIKNDVSISINRNGYNFTNKSLRWNSNRTSNFSIWNTNCCWIKSRTISINKLPTRSNTNSIYWYLSFNNISNSRWCNNIYIWISNNRCYSFNKLWWISYNKLSNNWSTSINKHWNCSTRSIWFRSLSNNRISKFSNSSCINWIQNSS